MERFTDPPIAIIGMGGLFAQATRLVEYWRLLYRGVDAITDPPETHAHLNEYFDPDPKKPDHIYCKRGGFLAPIPFDPTEFGIPPAAIEATDTSQLLGLVAAKMALKDAGYGENARAYDKANTSVILGVTGTQELVVTLGSRLGHPKWRRALDGARISSEKADQVMTDISNAYVPWQENSFPGLLGNVVAGRLCNRLDLGGTNCVVDAACASSLSAVHMALMELSTGRSRLVITGGVDTLNDIFMHMCFSKTGVLSKSGNARPFSKDADGTVLGEGVGLLVLKRLSDAVADKDRIYAVIKGLGSSSDGKSQSIYAPRVQGQVQALKTAYQRAGITPESIDLIEAHGTGTRVGDQVEFQSLCQVFAQRANPSDRCALGSVKSMIGHTKAAAGAAGLIKTALSLYHKVLPPTLKADIPDPQLNLEKSPFYLCSHARPWPAPKDHPRRAAVSAFGFGGSNFHAVLEEYDPQRLEPAWDNSVEIIAFSGETRQDIVHAIKNFTDEPDLVRLPGLMARQAAQSRRQFTSDAPHRCLMVVQNKHSVVDALHQLLDCFSHDRQVPSHLNDNHLYYGHRLATDKLAMVFPGQGSQYLNMARDLFCIFPEALKVLEQANASWSDQGRLSDIIFPLPSQDPEQTNAQAMRLRHTHSAQMALGTVEAAMLAILQRFNVSADAYCGHSYGELTALFAAGWYSLETLLDLSDARGRSMAQAGRTNSGETGLMLAVTAPLDQIEHLAACLAPDVVLANKNSPKQGVLSGTQKGIETARHHCEQKGWRCIQLPVAAAFHSPLIQPALAPFGAAVQAATLTPKAPPVYSNVSAQPYPTDIANARTLLQQQMVSAVEFVNIIQNLHQTGTGTFVEVGPKSVLSGLISAILGKDAATILSLDASCGRENGLLDLARMLCKLTAKGYSVDLTQWGPAPATIRKPRMQIMLSGANYTNPERRSKPTAPPPESRPAANTDRNGAVKQPEIQALTPPSLSRPEKQTRKRSSLSPLQALRPIDTKHNVTPISREIAPMSSKSHNHTPSDQQITASMAIVRQGIDSIQALHLQTAQAHQKFLDAQAEAGRTLQEMIKQTQQLAGMTSNGVSPQQSPRTTPAVEVENFANTPSAIPMDFTAQTPLAPVTPPLPAPSPSVPESSSTDLPEHTITPDPAAAKPAAKANPKGALENNLLDVVSELTGYPTDMLELSMDIESDLGIDSIKRVEILSTLEERMPALPTITPDMLGSLKTLGQIIDFLNRPAADTADRSAGSSAAPAAAPVAAATADQDSVQVNLLEVVSELTGYPTDMLELSMDIESDLGIDSIKRVEILSTLEERMPALPAITPDMLGTLKTLEQIIAYLCGTSTETQIPVSETSKEPPQILRAETAGIDQPPTTMPFSQTPLTRQVISLTKLPPPPPCTESFFGDNACLYITGDDSGLAQFIARAFEKKNIPTSIITSDAQDTAALPEDTAGLILTAPLPAERAFILAKAAAPRLLQRVKARKMALFATISRMDGAFGLHGRSISDPVHGALAGLVKTAAKEWEGVRCRALDIASDWQPGDPMATRIRDYLTADAADGPLEIGLTEYNNFSLSLQDAPYPDGIPSLSAEDVILITGGGRGVTAEAAIALAQASPCHIVLMGRSNAPEPEPPWLVNLQDAAAMKKAILLQEFSGKKVSPQKVEQRYRKWQSARQIQQTIAQINATGATATYFSQDVRDITGLSKLFKKIRSEIGPIKGLIHGAGVLEDRLIIEKTVAQFHRVYGTKVDALTQLLHALKDDDLDYLVFFSSVSARVGNRGQADYAMANEVLNKIAWQQKKIRPTCKVVSINWGPWDGGMVDRSLKREFQRRGVGLIPLSEGARAMVAEMSGPTEDPVEVVIGATFEPAANTSNERQAFTLPDQQVPRISPVQTDLSLLMQREIDLDHYPILSDHILGGQPVVPLALMTEWIGHSALHENPGLIFHGIDALRLMAGIKLDREKKTIRLMAGKARRKGEFYEVDVQIRNGDIDGKEMIHSKAVALLVDRLPTAPQYQQSALKPTADAWTKSLSDIYAETLFHGERLRGIQAILSYSADGIAARLTSAPEPSVWMSDPLRSHWILDPLVLDCAFQLAIVWCYEQFGKRCLPSFAATYRQYQEGFPGKAVTAILNVSKTNSTKMIGDFNFLDAKGNLLAQLNGYEAIMDTALNKAFGRQNAA